MQELINIIWRSPSDNKLNKNCIYQAFSSNCVLFKPKLTLMEQRDLLSNDLSINETSQIHLTASAKWGKFLSIVGFVFCGLMIIAGIYMMAVVSSSGVYASYAGEAAKIAGITYIISAIILIFPCLYLNKFSNKVQEAIRSTSQESLDAAFINLKAMFKFYGIVTIIFLVLFALAFIAGLGSAFLR